MYALLSSALATIVLALLALVFTACSHLPEPASETASLPVVPTTLVYSIDAPGGFDRHSIAHSKPHMPNVDDTFRLKGSETTMSLADAFDDNELDDTFSIADIPLEAPFHSTEISVLKAITCHAVEAHQPLDESTYFQAENGRVWLYTQVALPATRMGLIQHVWKRQGEVQHRVELFVQGPSYRTASYKTMNNQLKGDWTVEVTTENGEVLEVVEFQVQ